MELRDRIKTARKALGISQEDLARRANVSLSLINQIERGVVVDPHYTTLVSIAAALSMPIGELLEDPVPLAEAQREAGHEAKPPEVVVGMAKLEGKASLEAAAVVTVKVGELRRALRLVEAGEVSAEEAEWELISA